MALNPSGAISLGNVNVELGLSSIVQISLGATGVRTLYQVASGAIRLAQDGYGKSNITNTQKAIFGFGQAFPALVSMTNLVSNTGVVSTDTPGVGTARNLLAAAGYGGDKAIFGYGQTSPSPAVRTSITNLVSNTGVVASDTPGVGTARIQLAAASYGGDKAIFGFGASPSRVSMTNLVSNIGVVASDTPGVGSVRNQIAAAGYGGDKAIFGFGDQGPTFPVRTTSITNLVSNTGVVASDTPGVPGVSDRRILAAAGYGGDKAIFGFGSSPSISGSTAITNLVSNTGVVASDTPGVPGVSGRQQFAGAGYGGDKAIFGFGTSLPASTNNSTNLVSNTGVVASDTPGIGTIRNDLAAAGYSTTA